jgi:hypothetical protein
VGTSFRAAVEVARAIDVGGRADSAAHRVTGEIAEMDVGEVQLGNAFGIESQAHGYIGTILSILSGTAPRRISTDLRNDIRKVAIACGTGNAFLLAQLERRAGLVANAVARLDIYGSRFHLLIPKGPHYD